MSVSSNTRGGSDRLDITSNLSPPSPAERAHSASLVRYIREEMDADGGSIDFARYMELALYAPGLGYYSGGGQKFGASGDFITAAELSPLFARCLARQCRQLLDHLGQGNILEVGAGSGTLAVELLRELEALGSLPEQYLIIELSAELQQRQNALLIRDLPHLVDRVRWLQSLPHEPLTGVILANELLDAMPVHRFHISEHGVEQMYVTYEGERLVWDTQSASDAVRERVEPLSLPPSYVSEINSHAEAWVRSICERLHRGVVLLIDYGFPRREYYHPQRSAGTLMCHYRHRTHDDPLILTGLQDISAHVDFTAIAAAGFDAGLSVLGYTSQGAFLLANGLDELARASDPTVLPAHMDLAREINTLTSPAEMGELYKVIALGRDVDMSLQGFSLNDRRGRL